jgi:drug/metabolite transporter (DMT)-like permease
LLATAMQMIAGGALLLIASVIAGEWTRIRLDQVSFNSMIAWLYLIVFGSLVGYTSYIWLLKETTASRVSTYAYVNPIIAMFLGWAIAQEPITLRNVVAAIIILTSVVIITTFGAKTDTNQHEKNDFQH